MISKLRVGITILAGILFLYLLRWQLSIFEMKPELKFWFLIIDILLFLGFFLPWIATFLERR
ncbi:MAG: hypothetical protein ACE5K0_01155 [Candidatus Methanofastidiosia archaeon]